MPTASPLHPPYDDSLHYLAAIVRGQITDDPASLSGVKTNLIASEILDAARRSAQSGRTGLAAAAIGARAGFMSNLHGRGPRVCLVVPCFNEARRLDTAAFREFVSACAHADVRIVFVDDGSRDATRQILEALCEGSEDRAMVLALPQNRGKAEAVRAGVNHALERFQPEIVGYWDADLATPLSAVNDFLRVFERFPNILMVFGARVKLLGRNVKRHALRHYLGRVFATAVSTMLRLAIYDTQCGAKLFRVNDAFRASFARPFLSKWVFDVEILARYLNYFERDTDKLARAVYEYPLEQWIDIAGSKVRAKDFLKAFLDIVRIKRAYL